jgi:type IV pilus assembly protein PilE
MHTNKLSLKSQKGFTLIELMIVVAIIGILTSIAYPSYIESVAKSRRADAKGALLGFANAMERHFTETNSYCNAAVTDSGACVAATGIPTVFSATSPVGGGAANYNLTISAATATTYTLSAARTGSQASDKCGTLTLTHTGQRGVSLLTVADCW